MGSLLKAPVRLAREWLGQLPSRRPEVDLACVVLGTEYGGHAVALEGLNADSICFSVGLGEDVSFDLELIERTGLTIHGYDPTPRSLEWLARQDLPSEFHVHPEGIATYDGQASFVPPKNPAHISHTILERTECQGEPITVEVRRLETLAREVGVTRIDVLKLDVEGIEYEVNEDVLSPPLEIGQLLVEYHHQFKEIPARRTMESIALLRSHGFLTYHVAPNGRDLSFVNTRLG